MACIHADKRVQYPINSVTMFPIRVSILSVGFIQIPFFACKWTWQRNGHDVLCLVFAITGVYWQ